MMMSCKRVTIKDVGLFQLFLNTLYGSVEYCEMSLL